MPRVLVIDDDESVRAAIAALLQTDFEIVLAENARRGAERFVAEKFDVVMVDIFMPDMNGLETIKDFRRLAPDMPIVAMSGFRFRNVGVPTPDFLKIAADLGATYCLSKPFRPQQLEAAIAACLPSAVQT